MMTLGRAVRGGVGRVDLLACSLLASREGMEVFEMIEKETKADFAGSTNLTGNPKYVVTLLVLIAVCALFFVPSPPRIHAHTRTHTQTNTNARGHTHTPPHTHTHSLTLTHTLTNTLFIIFSSLLWHVFLVHNTTRLFYRRHSVSVQVLTHLNSLKTSSHTSITVTRHAPSLLRDADIDLMIHPHFKGTVVTG
jgi:hypothetical protein